MKRWTSFLLAFALSGTAAFATSTFTGIVDTDFANLGNWDNGLPASGNDGIIRGGLTADLASEVIGGTSTLYIGDAGEAGTLNINSGGRYATANGGASDVRIGVGAGSVGTLNINNGGTLAVLGAGADLFLGDAAGGQGFLTVTAGGTLDARKAVEIINGTLTLAPTAVFAPNQPKDEVVVGNNGTLAFQTDGATMPTIRGGTLLLELGALSTLHMSLGGSFSVGDTWTLMTGISSFGGVDGGDGTGVFGTVLDPTNPDHQFAVHYGDGLAGAGELVVELAAIPEPSTSVLVGLALGLLALRRR